MREHVARALCWAARHGPTCNHCDDDRYGMPVCGLWTTFLGEADAAIGAIRDYAMLTPRKKPRRP